MLFNSFQFLVFYPIVAALYFALPFRYRFLLLLAASYWFYMAWKPIYGVLLACSTAWDWFIALRIDATEDPVKRKQWLTLSLTASLLLLGTFKYFNLFNDTVGDWFGTVGVSWPIPASHLILPVGISFYTLQTMSYVIDVYRRRLKAEPNFLYFALFVAFFPHMVAGPIMRASELLPQFHVDHRFDADRLVSGVRLMVWGMFKKVVIADNVAPVVQAVFGSPRDFAGPSYIIALFCFMLQVYCDFSGYSDIAVGAARILGIDLIKNFDQPYGSRSITEFWNRWHISLTSWFRDYLYIPLGGNRVSPARRYLNVMIMFTISGLWHGAEWHFLLWGMLHGFYLVVDLATRDARERFAQASGLAAFPNLRGAIGIATTLALVQLSYVLFCTRTLSDALYVYAHLLTGASYVSPRAIAAFFHRIQVDGQLTMFILAIYPLVELVEYARRTPWLFNWWIARVPTALRWSADWGLIAGTLLLGRFEEQIFMYFQF